MTKKINKPILFKSCAIAVITLLMLIPLGFVQDVIGDRASYKSEAVSKITESWGREVFIAAPVLNIPYQRKEVRTINSVAEVNGVDMPKSVNEIVVVQDVAKYAPDNINAKIDVKSQIRYIGIFEIPVFEAEITITGDFGKIHVPSGEVKLDDAFISLELNSLKGISTPSLIYNGKDMTFEPNRFSGHSIFLNYYYGEDGRVNYYSQNTKLIPLSAPILFKNGAKNEFELKFKIKGAEYLAFVPLAKNNKFHMTSDWAHPNFSGSFLPDTKNITNDGFEAFWNINYLASGVSPRFEGEDLSEAVFSTAFILPVDNYKTANRAVKYGLLFIVLTFAACFAFEAANKKPIHPIQYIFVGFAMSIFYTLLVSISEFLGFGLSYLIAAFATIALITAYAKISVMKDMSKKEIIFVIFWLVFIYGFLYALLQLKDMAFLYGSIGLFIALAVLMYITKNIGWYEEQN